MSIVIISAAQFRGDKSVGDKSEQGFLVAEYHYWQVGDDQKTFGIPAWDERGLADLDQTFASVREALNAVAEYGLTATVEQYTGIYADQNAHCYAFRNAPLSQRQMWTKLKIAEMEEELRTGLTGRSADAYYQLKDSIREFRAGLVGKKPWEYDPMGHWFGMQSN